MKIWVKLLIGIVIGALLAFLLDADSVLDIFEAITGVVINIGRYTVFPLVLFSTAMGIYELRREKRLLAVVGRTLLYLVTTSALLAMIGTASTLIFKPERIPFAIEQEIAYSIPTFRHVLEEIFPKNMFRILIDSGDYLLPVFIFAVLFGLNLNFDRLATRPSTQLFDSLTRVFYNMNALVLELIGVGFIPITTAFIMRILVTPEMALYTQLILVLFIDAIFLIFVLYPILLYVLGRKKQPIRLVYANIANLLAAALSRDAYFSLSCMIRHVKESLGVQRKVGAVSLPLFALFGKAGTAMVTGASFILIITSYSALGVSFGEVVWVMLFAFLSSLVVGPFPGIGAFVALSILSAGFPAGYEEGYLILKPMVPILMSFAVAIDVITASLATTLVAEHSNMRKEIEIKEYV